MSAGTKSRFFPNPMRRALGTPRELRLGIFLSALIMAVAARGQEAFRQSQAGQAAVEAKKAALANEKFNIQLGPISLRTHTTAQVEATDNVRFSKTNRVADLIFRPQVSVLASWQVSEKNRLTLSAGVGYSKYLKTTEYDSLFLSPNSDLDFDVFVTDFKINLHDRFQYSQDVSTDPSVSGVGSLSRFENTAGVGVDWDLNKAMLSIGYDHLVSITMEDAYGYQNHAAELLNARAGFDLNPFTVAGLEAGGGFKDFDQQVLSDNQHVSAGPFIASRLSEYLELKFSGGYVVYFFDANAATNSAPGTLSGIYADLTVRHRLNATFSHTLSAGRQLQSGLYSETLDVFYVRHEAKWNVFRKTSLNTWFSYEYTRTTGLKSEVSDRFGFGLRLGRPWTERVSSSLTYQFYFKKADPEVFDYVQNQLVLDLGYAF